MVVYQDTRLVNQLYNVLSTGIIGGVTIPLEKLEEEPPASHRASPADSLWFRMRLLA